MVYFTTLSTHFIYGYMALDIIMVNNQSDCEKENPLPFHMGYSFRLAAFYMYHPADRIAHTTAFVKPVVEHVTKLPREDIRGKSYVFMRVATHRLVLETGSWGKTQTNYTRELY